MLNFDYFRYILLFSALFVLKAGCDQHVNLPEVPEFTRINDGPYILNIEQLEYIKENQDSLAGVPEAMDNLISGADSLLNVTFEYVPDQLHIPPSGDPHDYLSIHRYSYPDSSGNYSIINEQQTNPEFYEYDKPKLEKISAAVYTLALAYFFTGDEKYAEKASNELRNWFINPETRMNPNMNYSSVRPGIDESIGGAGIVGAIDFLDMIEAATLIYDSPHWTSDLHYELKEWFFQFYQWLRDNYPTDAFHTSNVSTWLDVQRITYLLFIERGDQINSNSHVSSILKRIESQRINENGLQTFEVSRWRSQHYVYFNLKAYVTLASIRKNQYSKTGYDRDWLDLKRCLTEGCNAGGIHQSVNNISVFLKKNQSAGLFSTDSDFNICRYQEIFKPAAYILSNSEYSKTASYLYQKGCNNSNLLLTYPPLAIK